LFQRINTRLRAGGNASGIAFDFRSGALDPRISFTRASAAWYFDSTGNLVQASTNEPRFDYDPATLQARGLLVESSRTNGIRNPRLEGAVAGTPGTAPTNMFFSGPTGLTQQIVEISTENNMNFVSVRWSGTTSASGRLSWFMESGGIIAATVGQTFAASNFCKTVAGTYPTAGAIFSFAEQDATATTIATGTVAVQAPFASGTRISASRVSASYTMAQATAAFVRPVWNSDTINSGVAVDVTIRFAAPQTELGSFPTSPIFPAVGSPAASTRAADNVSVATLTPWFNPNEGTILVEYQRPFVGFNQFEVNFSDGTYGEFIGLYTSATNQIAEIRQGAASQAGLVLEAGAGVNDRLNKKILAYQVNNFAASLNGAAPIVDTSGSVPIGLTTMRIGTFQGGSQFCSGWISRIAYYPTRLSNTTLQGLTS
jgi:hypothetical protein